MASNIIAGQVKAESGSAAVPSIGFNDSPGAGLFLKSGNVIGLAVGGAEVTSFGASGSTGTVGSEIISRVTSNTSVGTSAQYFDMTSITLTAGSWDVSGYALIRQNGATFTSTDFQIGVGTVTGNDSTGIAAADAPEFALVAPTTFTKFGITLPPQRITVTSDTVYYLKGFVSVYTAGTPQYNCRFRAVKVI